MRRKSGHGGSSGQSEVAAGEMSANVGLVTLRKRRTMGTNLGQNQPVMLMAASLSRAPGHLEWGTLFIVVVNCEMMRNAFRSAISHSTAAADDGCVGGVAGCVVRLCGLAELPP